MSYLRSPGGQGSKSHLEEVEPGEGDHVDGQLAQVGVELTGKSQGGRDAGLISERIGKF